MRSQGTSARTSGTRGRQTASRWANISAWRPRRWRHFEATLRGVEQLAAAPAGDKDATLAHLRFLSWADALGARLGVAFVPDELEVRHTLDDAHKQVRAVELVLRSLVAERYGDEAQVLAGLDAALTARALEACRKQADPDDLLSGLSFGQLASLIVNKREFGRYEPLYEDADVLTLLRHKRKTLRAFLDDVRRVRNRLAHNKRLSGLDIELMDHYYAEIVEPIDAAHRQGKTSVDPSAFLDASSETLSAHLETLREDLQAVHDEVVDVRAGVETVAKRTAGMDKRLWLVLAGIAALLVGGFFLFGQGESIEKSSDATREAAELGRRASEAAAASTARNEAIATRTEASAARTEEKTEALAQRVVQSLDGLKEGFQALAQQGGIIEEPERPEAHYHNARTYEARGETQLALGSYRAFFESTKFPFLDPHLRYQELLKVQRGLAGARAAYATLRPAAPEGVVARYATALLEDDATRTTSLQTLSAEHPTFAPLSYTLAGAFSTSRLGKQFLEDKRQEHQHLAEFLKRVEDGEFLRYFLDQSVAATWLEQARTRLRAIEASSHAAFKAPVSISGQLSNQGWTMTISVQDVAKEIFWRPEGKGAYLSTGHMTFVDPRSGMPMAQQHFAWTENKAQRFEIKYVDPRGRELGPYLLAFEPTSAREANMLKMVQLTKLSWAHLRRYDGRLLIYFTSLLMHREVLRAIHYGIDSDEPDTAWPLPGPGEKDPSHLPEGVMPYGELPLNTKFVTVQVTFKDGTKSDVVRYDAPK